MVIFTKYAGVSAGVGFFNGGQRYVLSTANRIAIKTGN